MPLALYMDEQVPSAITRGLRRRGVDVLRVQANAHGNTDDSIILDRALALGRVIFTRDKDFLVIVHHRQGNGIAFGGVAFAHQLNLSIRECIEDLELIAFDTELSEWADHLEYLLLCEASRMYRILSLAPLVAVVLSPAFVAADWPVARGDALMTGAATAKLPEQLEVKWTFKAKDAVEGAPAIVGSIVYIASLDKHLYAVDLTTGKEKWKVKLGAMKAAPSVKGDRVYVGNLDGMFFCLNAADGSKVWQFETTGEITAGCNFHGNNILFGSHDSTLYCLGADGKKVWEVKTDGPVNGSPSVIGDTTFVAGCDSILHILDAKTGKEVGAVDLGGQAAATAAIANDFAYVGTMANTVVAVDLKKKEKAWSFEAAARQQPFFASAAASELVVAGSRDKKVYGLNPKTGKAIWNFTTEGQVDSSPVVVNGKVYVGCLSDEGHFYVLDLKSGKKLQELSLDSAVCGSPAVGPDCIILGTDKGVVYCLGKK